MAIVIPEDLLLLKGIIYLGVFLIIVTIGTLVYTIQYLLLLKVFVQNYVSRYIFILFTFCIKNICFGVFSCKNKCACYSLSSWIFNGVNLRLVHRIRCFCLVRSKLT